MVDADQVIVTAAVGADVPAELVGPVFQVQDGTIQRADERTDANGSG